MLELNTVILVFIIAMLFKIADELLWKYDLAKKRNYWNNAPEYIYWARVAEIIKNPACKPNKTSVLQYIYTLDDMDRELINGKLFFCGMPHIEEFQSRGDNA